MSTPTHTVPVLWVTDLLGCSKRSSNAAAGERKPEA
jgi:hypothetical protein